MNRFVSYVILLLLMITGPACERFFDPEQKEVVYQDDYFKVWSDFQSFQMGVYSAQQRLADQMMVLGEVRGDMVRLTENADNDLLEIYNFNVSPSNRYARPDNFYQLIGRCNELISRIIEKSPGVLDPERPANNYDLLYGEMQCMLAWAYFNAARIWEKVPYIPVYINGIEKVETYINTERVVIDSTNIIFDYGGLFNDTLSAANPDTVHLPKLFISMDAVIDTFTTKLKDIKVDINGQPAIGVDYSQETEDPTYLNTFWTPLSYYMLLGQMYFYEGNLYGARDQFMKIGQSVEGADMMMGNSNSYRGNSWQNIFRSLNRKEHIFVIWYDDAFKQQNNLQKLFSLRGSNAYMLKPSPYAISLFEREFFEAQWYYEPSTGKKIMKEDGIGGIIAGRPGDFYRGYGVSYAYFKDGVLMPGEDVQIMLDFKKTGEYRQSRLIMQDVDTVVYKYDIGKGAFERDAYYYVYRTSAITLYLAELYATVDLFKQGGTDIYAGSLRITEGYLNDKVSISVTNGEPIFGDMGVRGRVYPYRSVTGGYAPIQVSLINAVHHPDNNSIIGHLEFGQGEKRQQQEYMLDQILDERGREMAFEGERFYDLFRIAKKTGDFERFVASRVAVGDRSHLYTLLQDESACYLPWFD